MPEFFNSVSIFYCCSFISLIYFSHFSFRILLVDWSYYLSISLWIRDIFCVLSVIVSFRLVMV